MAVQVDSAVVERSSLHRDEVYSYLAQLQSLGYLEMDIEVRGSDVRLLNIKRGFRTQFVDNKSST